VVYDPLLILGPLAGSVLLGLLAGAYPAWQAAHVEVLEVLRNE
jgi:putative ABC transport system permease protein